MMGAAKKILAILIICVLLIFFGLVSLVRGYPITGDRELDANCLGYSKEVRDEIIKQGGKATLIGFRRDKRQGHCLVLVNYKTKDWKIIESYTGEEFTDIPTLWRHLILVLGTSPNSVSIKEGHRWTGWQEI